MITLPTPKDIETRNNILKMTEKSLDKDIKRMIKLLNTRLARLEKSGFVKYAPAYYKVQSWLKENTDGTGTFKFSNTKGMSIKEKSNYLTMLYHFEGYKLTVTEAKKTRENLRKVAEQELGYKPTYEQVDKIGELMGTLYRDSDGISSIFSEIFTSDEARLWITEHIDITVDQSKQFLKDLEDFVNDGNGKLTSQDIKDFIDDYVFDDNGNIYEINGFKVDRNTGKLVRYDTGEIIEEYDYDPTGERIYDANGFIANVDEDGVEIPVIDFLRGKYGYI